MYTCIFCNKKFKNAGGKATHSPYCKNNPNKIKRNKSPKAHRKKGSVGFIPWNKGLKNDIRCKHKEETKLKCTGKAKTPELELERKRKIKEKSKNNGGYRIGSGRGKKGWYKGFFCDSSYELAYVIYCLDNDIQIERNFEKRQYIWNNKIRNYIPDFKVNNELIEIKGYKSEQWEAKQKSNPDIKVLYENDLLNIFKYVELKYGKNFINLYEKEGRVKG